MLSFLCRVAAVAVVAGLGLATGAGGAARAAEPLVFAAASLKNAIDEINAEWRRETGMAVSASYAASSALARQIEQGAPADIFISADLDWMDYLQQRNLIKADTRTNLLGNTLVLIAPAGSIASFDIHKGADLGAFIADGRLAVGEVLSVPAGRYAKQALMTLGIWAGVEDKLAQTDSVRAALALVARAEATAGIVYATDAKAEPKVRVLGAFPADTHAPIIYPVALVASSTDADAPAFLGYLRSPAALRTFDAHGLIVLEQ
jgi:molybdate transport system substrate-binding protein